MIAAGVLAPAKVNLFLHVTGRRADGYHLLDSLVAFADIGDRVDGARRRIFCRWRSAARRQRRSPISATTISCCAPPGSISRPRSGAGAAALFLDKRLPAASGIGGGSSDAAATLRLLDYLSGGTVAPAALAALAARLGADVPACLAARPVWVGGIGEVLEPADGVPDGRHRSGQPADRAAHSCGVSRAQREVFGAGAVCPDAARRRRARPRCWRPAATI